MTATITRLPHDEWPWVVALTFDYNPAMVEAIKRHIPSRDREWRPGVKEWRFRLGQLEAIEALCAAYCGGHTYLDARQPRSPVDEDYAALHLLPTAPPSLVKAAYRVMAKQCHPDRGGDTAVMQRINAAYERLAQRLEADYGK